jgi:hypothetical protein
MELKVRKDYNYKMKKGQIVIVDKIRRDHCATGFMVRVVGIWKEPKWFDMDWFVLARNNSHDNP